MYGDIEHPGKIEVDVNELNELRNDSRFLKALESAGVENWMGYEFAMEIYDTFK